MKQFANTFRPIDEILTERGFTLYGDENRNYVTKISDGVYVVISGDLELTEIWNVNPEMTDDEFTSAVAGNDWDMYDDLRDAAEIEVKDFAWAIGFN